MTIRAWAAQRRPRLLATLALMVLALPTLAACSSAGSTTCDQYASMSSDKRDSTEDALLSSHNLKTLSVTNKVALTQKIDDFCGVRDNVIAGMPGSDKATRNNSAPIDKAVDWSRKTW